MNRVRVEFDRAQYRPGDDVNLLVWPGGVSLSGEREGASSGDATLSITITVSHLADPFYEASVDLRPADLAGDAPVQITIPASALARHLEWHDRALKAKGFGLDVDPGSTVTGHTEGVFGIGDLGFMRVCGFGGGQNRKSQ